MAINTIKGTIQMRKGLERDFDPEQMTAGEWGVSTDSKKVWMCFAPGIVLRMATYEGFEEDMRQIQAILASCDEILSTVENLKADTEEFKNAAGEYASSAGGRAESAAQSAILSESWAVGGTGERDGEDTNNAAYWAGVARETAVNMTYEETMNILNGGDAL